MSSFMQLHHVQNAIISFNNLFTPEKKVMAFPMIISVMSQLKTALMF